MAISPPDWSVHWRAEDAAGHPRTAAAAMIDWLAARPPSVWHAFARDYLDLERGAEVAAWIVAQPACDRATAALLLFRLDPAYYLMRQRLEFDDRSADGHPLIAAVLANFARDHYRDSRIEQDFAPFAVAVAAYRREIERFAARRRTPAFVVPAALIGPFAGAAASFPADADPYDDPHLWALIDRLGRAGLNRASAAWHDAAEAAWRRWQQERAADGWWQRLTRQPAAIVPFGPEFASEGERQRYLAGDAAVSRLVLERARAAAHADARRAGRRFDALRLAERSRLPWQELPWSEVRDALAAALPLPRLAAPLAALGRL